MKKNNFLDKIEFSLQVLLPETFNDYLCITTMMSGIMLVYFIRDIFFVFVLMFLFTTYCAVRLAEYARKQWHKALQREKENIEFLLQLTEMIESSEKPKRRKRK